MAWKYKEEKCACGADLAGIEPMPLGPDKAVANCPKCWRTPEIVEVAEEAPQPEPEPAPAPAAAPAPAPEPPAPPEPPAGPAAHTEPEPET